MVLAVPEGPDLRVDTWLMSCRVLGRGVDIATMRVLTETARDKGFARVIGEYIPTSRNEPARLAYQRAGFTAVAAVDGQTSGEIDGTAWVFDLARDTVPDPGHITTT